MKAAYFVHRRLLHACLIAVTLAGCFTAEKRERDEDEGEDDVVNCSYLCDRINSECGASSTCLAECTALTTIPGCTQQGSAWVSCLSGASYVCELPLECDPETGELSTCFTTYCLSNPSAAICDDGSSGDCPYTNDGECDEPEGLGYCADGTDVNDCMPCLTTNDGECDETKTCSVGLDDADCECTPGSTGNSCLFACDFECDEPGGTGVCEQGTDAFDCANF